MLHLIDPLTQHLVPHRVRHRVKAMPCHYFFRVPINRGAALPVLLLIGRLCDRMLGKVWEPDPVTAWSAVRIDTTSLTNGLRGRCPSSFLPLNVPFGRVQ